MNDRSLPTVIKHYRLLSKLGEGGMGEVYLAQDTQLGRKVALKFLPQDVVTDPERLHRFEREAQTASALNHPNIMTIHEIGHSDGMHFIVGEFVEGETLRLKKTFSIKEAVEIAIQVVAALDTAHQNGITHRDIKPENIMVRADGLVKVLDFGLAKLSQPAEVEHDASTQTFIKTSPGIVMGTVPYMSPEQARGLEIDGRSDLFSFGIVLHEMLSGRSPFARETTSDVIAAILMADALPPSAFNTKTPIELDRIVGKTLRKDRDERYQSAADILRDLKSLQGRLQFSAEFEATRSLKSAELPTQISSRSSIRSLAVLPFTNASDDSKMEYLSDGLTESVLFGLSQLPEIQIVARSAVFRHKNSTEDPLTIGRTLGVKAVVTGRVRQRGATLMISAELIDVDSGLQLWGAQYKRPGEELFGIEDEIADEILHKLRLTLSPEQQKVIDRRRTENTQAYHSYLKARFYWGKRTEESLQKALELFREAIDADPLYAIAYAGLAECYMALTFYCYMDPNDSVPKARAAAERAIEIEPELPDAITVLGAVCSHYEWNFVEGELLLRKAIDLDPKYPRARQTLAECLNLTGRPSEAIDEVKKALDLDPLSLHTNAALVMDNYFARRHVDAIKHGSTAIDLDRSFYPTRYFLGLAYQASGDLEAAVAELRQARTLSDGNSLMTATLAAALMTDGKEDEANALLRELDELLQSRYVSQTAIAAAYACKGDVDECLRRLERAYDERCIWLAYALRSDARFDAVRNEPRFERLSRRVFVGM